MELDGRRLLVTGGASGIGLACAQMAARLGARIVVADRNAEALAAVATGEGLAGVAMDVGDEASVAAGLAESEREIGPLDGLVHAAGILQRTLPPGELTLKEWDKIQSVDLRGTYLVARAAGLGMAARGSGSIVTIASVAGMTSGPLASYAPAKAGVISLTQVLAVEWGRRGVRVNSVSPGFTETPALRKGVETATLSEADLARTSALGRLVAADEVASAVCFLLSDRASAITGVNLPVDAGYLVGTTWMAYGGPRPAPDRSPRPPAQS